MMSSAPMPNRPASKAVMAPTEKDGAAPSPAGRVTPRRIRPSAVSARPHHWRGPTVNPKSFSAMTASSTIPPDSTAWTTESGARVIAATCKPQAPAPTSMPIANQRWLHSEYAVRRGWRMSTAQASHAPRCL